METNDVTNAAEERRRSSVVSVRFSEDEIERLREQAEREGVSLSVVVRRAVLSKGSVVSTPSESRSKNTTGVAVSGQYSVMNGGTITSVGKTTTPNLSYAAPR